MVSLVLGRKWHFRFFFILITTFVIFGVFHLGGEVIRSKLSVKVHESSSKIEPIGETSRLTIVEQQMWEVMSSNCTGIPLNEFMGNVSVHTQPESHENLIKEFPFIKNGHFSPKHCQPPERVAIIIPFRDRQTHLYTLLPNILPMMVKQGTDFTIFVVEQDLPTSFNKGVVYNAGFLEALKIDNFDCFIFHDVDMLPLNDLNFYQCDPRGPVHFMAGVNKFKYGLIYPMLIGGVLGFTREQFQRVNGFSNLYFGWGAEDDDMSLRIRTVGMKLFRRPQSIGLYDMIKHNRDKRWSPNMGRFDIRKHAAKRTEVEGLNTVKYTVTNIQGTQFYVHIRIFVNMTEVYDTAPTYMKKIVANARDSDQENRVKEGTA